MTIFGHFSIFSCQNVLNTPTSDACKKNLGRVITFFIFLYERTCLEVLKKYSLGRFYNTEFFESWRHLALNYIQHKDAHIIQTIKYIIFKYPKTNDNNCNFHPSSRNINKLLKQQHTSSSTSVRKHQIAPSAVQ